MLFYVLKKYTDLREEKKMALINCPECGKQVSDQAQNCPGCGYVIQGTLADQIIKEEVKQEIKLGKGASIAGLIIIGLAYLFTIIAVIRSNIANNETLAQGFENVAFAVTLVSVVFLWIIVFYILGHVFGLILSLILSTVCITFVFGVLGGVLEKILPAAMVDIVSVILVLIPVVLFVIYLIKNIKASNEVLEKI